MCGSEISGQVFTYHDQRFSQKLLLSSTDSLSTFQAPIPNFITWCQVNACIMNSLSDRVWTQPLQGWCLLWGAGIQIKIHLYSCWQSFNGDMCSTKDIQCLQSYCKLLHFAGHCRYTVFQGVLREESCFVKSERVAKCVSQFFQCKATSFLFSVTIHHRVQFQWSTTTSIEFMI